MDEWMKEHIPTHWIIRSFNVTIFGTTEPEQLPNGRLRLTSGKLHDLFVNYPAFTINNCEYRLSAPIIYHPIHSQAPSFDNQPTRYLSPQECQQRELTWSIPVYTCFIVNNKKSVIETFFFWLPLMVGCKFYQPKQLDLYDTPGYFIINGMMKSIVSVEGLSLYFPLYEQKSINTCNVNVPNRHGQFQMYVDLEKNHGIMVTWNARAKEQKFKLVDLLFVLGYEEEIPNYPDHFARCSDDPLFVLGKLFHHNQENIYENHIQHINDSINGFLFVHLGTCKLPKIAFLLKMAKDMIDISRGNKPDSHSKSMEFKRIATPGERYYEVVTIGLKNQMNVIKRRAEKMYRDRQTIDIQTIMDSKMTYGTTYILSALATGNFKKGEKGAMRIIKHGESVLQAMAIIRRTVVPTRTDSRVINERQVHGTQWNYKDAVETPEGKRIAFIGNPALFMTVTIDEGLNEWNMFLEQFDTFIYTFLQGPFIILNHIITCNLKPENKAEVYVKCKLFKQLHFPESSVYIDDDENICIETTSARMSCPYFVASKYHLYEKYKYTWAELIKQGIIEYIDTREQNNIIVCEDPRNKFILPNKYTHLVLDPVGMFGIMANSLPFIHKNPGNRAAFASVQAAQGVGKSNYQSKRHIKGNYQELWYPQKPIITTKVSKEYLKLEETPIGQAVTMFVLTNNCTYEDGIAFSEAYSQLGGFRMQVEITTTCSLPKGVEFGIPDNINEKYDHLDDHGIIEIQQPVREGTVLAYQIDSETKQKVGKFVFRDQLNPDEEMPEYDPLDFYSLEHPNEKIYVSQKTIYEKEAYVEHFIYDTTNKHKRLIKQTKINSIEQYKNPVPVWKDTRRYMSMCRVSKVMKTIDEFGNPLLSITCTYARSVSTGHKFNSLHGQKSTVGEMISKEDLPYIAFGVNEGITPDIIINPHAIPSRMTIGHLHEMITGKTKCLLPGDEDVYDGTPFKEDRIDHICNLLKELGMQDKSHDRVISGTTGLMMNCLIFNGVINYNVQARHPAGLLNYISTGTKSLSSRQTIRGRAKHGGSRYGQMERDATAAHGASAVLQDRMGTSSDLTRTFMCPKCNETDTGNEIMCIQCNIQKEWMDINYAYLHIARLLKVVGVDLVLEKQI
jgi:DNA-directed RNA polymerase beta subunit